MGSEGPQLRILFATHEAYPTARPDVATLFGKYLPRYGVCSDIVTSASFADAAARWAGGEVFLYYPRGRRLLDKVRALWHCSRELFCRARRYSALQVRDRTVLAGVALLVGKLRRVPFFYWMSLPFPEAYIEQGRSGRVSLGRMRATLFHLYGIAARLLLYRIVLPYADHVFVQSESMKDWLSKCGIDARRMTAVPMGVDTELLPLDVSLATGEALWQRERSHGPAIVYLGALDRIRRIDFLIDVLLQVRREFPLARLLLIGGAPEAVDIEWLKQRVRESGAEEAVSFAGSLPREQAWALARSGDVGVSPIPPTALFQVSSPTKAAEYLALGLPVVGNAIPDQRWVIESSRGGICVEYDAQAFAGAICTLLRDPAEARRMAARGKQFVARHRSYAVLGEGLAQCYRQVIAS